MSHGANTYTKEVGNQVHFPPEDQLLNTESLTLRTGGHYLQGDSRDPSLIKQQVGDAVDKDEGFRKVSQRLEIETCSSEDQR